MPTQAINLIKGKKVGTNTDYRDALPVNMYAVIDSVLGAAGYMMQSSGLKLHGTANDVCRGGVWNDRFSEHYRVNGTELNSVDLDGNHTLLGAVSGSEPVSLPFSFNTQGIVTGGNFYLYDSVNGFRKVTDSDLGNPIDCVWVDGYYFFTDGEYIYHTDIADESAIDPLKFATAEFMPDKSLGLGRTQDNKVIVFGRYSMEYFVNTAQDNFAFQRIATRTIKMGIVATHCKAELHGKWYILGGSKEDSIYCYAASVGGSSKISTREIDKIIGEYAETDFVNSVVEAYSEDNNSFIIYHLPNHTLLFNETIASKMGIDQAWSVLKSDVLGSTKYRGIHTVYDARIGAWTIGDNQDGSLGILDDTLATQYDQIVEWELYTPFLYLDGASIDELEIETMPGHTGSDDATVFISLTYNGLTFGNEWVKMYGLPNDYSHRFILRRLGHVRDWVGLKMRGATRSRMAFGRGMVTHA